MRRTPLGWILMVLISDVIAAHLENRHNPVLKGQKPLQRWQALTPATDSSCEPGLVVQNVTADLQFISWGPLDPTSGAPELSDEFTLSFTTVLASLQVSPSCEPSFEYNGLGTQAVMTHYVGAQVDKISAMALVNKFVETLTSDAPPGDRFGAQICEEGKPGRTFGIAVDIRGQNVAVEETARGWREGFCATDYDYSTSIGSVEYGVFLESAVPVPSDDGPSICDA